MGSETMDGSHACSSCHTEEAWEFSTLKMTICCFVFNLNTQTCCISASCLQVNSKAVEHGPNSPTNWFECGDLGSEGVDLDDRLKEFIL